MYNVYRFTVNDVVIYHNKRQLLQYKTSVVAKDFYGNKCVVRMIEADSIRELWEIAYRFSRRAFNNPKVMRVTFRLRDLDAKFTKYSRFTHYKPTSDSAMDEIMQMFS